MSVRDDVAALVGEAVTEGVWHHDNDYFCGWQLDAKDEVYAITDRILAAVTGPCGWESPYLPHPCHLPAGHTGDHHCYEVA